MQMARGALASLNVQTIDHVTLVVKDLERSREFYRDLLGMAETTRPGFGFPGLWFQAGNTQIHMNVAGPDAGPAGMPPFAGTAPSRGFHFAFEVADCLAAAEQLRQLGIKIVVGPRPRPDGPMQLYIYDPDNYLVEIYSR
jgi:catechol 2,3-dioxygenase-like lactoylglutathione lyase family enzyme